MGGGGSRPCIDPGGRPAGGAVLSFLETPGWALPGRPDVTYRELSEQQGVPLSLVLGLHEAIGFHPPDPDERVRQDELVMVELAPTHIGIHAGPVVAQDGDVFGRTVNIAARIAARAGAGEVLTSAETVELVEDARLRFVRVGTVILKGIARPVTRYRVARQESS